jgi:hypothetical protein
VTCGIFRVMNTLQFTDDELLDAAEAARLASAQADKEAEKQNSPRVKALLDANARRFAELAKKFERARQRCA